MTPLALQFLGAPTVCYDGQVLKFATRKTLALLIYLVVEEGLHSREKLTALFWPDSNAKRGRASLRNTLGYLRSTLRAAGAPLIIEHHTLGFSFETEVDLDLRRLKIAQQALQAKTPDSSPTPLQAALDAYRGDFLEGFSLGDAPDFDDWAGMQREHWHRQIGRVCDRLSQMQFDGGEINRALKTVSRWLTLDPWDEVAYRRLMRLHFAAGDRTAALQAYESCRTMLTQEFGAGPTPETESLAARLRAEASPRRAGAPLTLPQPALQPFETPFIGRASEHTALVKSYYTACRGEPQVVVLAGEAGIGKTRLAVEFLRWATGQRADVLRGRAFETGGRLPYQPVAQAWRNRLEQENAPEDLLSDVWLAELSRLLPELRDRYPDLAEPPAREEAAARQRLFEAVARLGQALARRAPLLLFIDDIQWADAASLDLLHYAALRWRESRSPILLLLCLRGEALPRTQPRFETTPELQSWLLDLGRDLAVTRLTLAPLTAEDTLQLVQSLPAEVEAGEHSRLEAFSRWLFAETEGLPFFMTETLQALITQRALRPDFDSRTWSVDWPALEQADLDAAPLIPSGVRQVILERLSRLSPAASELLAAAAVLGQGASYEYLYEVAGLDDRQGLSALDELLGRRLLLETGAGQSAPGGGPFYIFAHDKFREVVYSEASETRRRVLHRRSFEILQAATAQLPEHRQRAAELAHHALAAGLAEAAFRYSLVAGDQAMRLFAVRDAITYYEQARHQLSTFGNEQLTITNLQSLISNLYLNLGRAYELSDAWDQAKIVYEATLEEARATGQAGMECLALNRLATVYIHGLFKLEEATALLQQALTIAAKSKDNLGLAETEWNLALAAQMDGQLQPARHHAGRALALARQLEHKELIARSLNVLAYINLRLRHWEAVAVCAEEARAYYAAAGDRALESDCLRQLGMARTFSGQPHEAIEALREAHRISLEIENRWGEADCLFHLGNALLEIGLYGEALRLAQQAVAQCRTVGHPHLVAVSLVILGKAQRGVLALDAARTTQLEALAAQGEAPSPIFSDWPLDELCAIYALAGDWETAHAYARQALQVQEKEALLPMAFTGWLKTEALLRGGDEELARVDVHRLGELTGNNRRYRIPYLRSLAGLAEWDGDTEQAIAHLQEALTLAEDIGLPGEQWQILAKLGELYQAIGDEEQAQRVFSQAAEIVQALAANIDDEGLRATFLAGRQR